MPTNRTRIRRVAKVEISEEMISLFLRQQELWPVYFGCISKPYHCQSPQPGTRCAECTELNSITDRLRALARTPDWTPSGLVDSPDPPKALIRPRTRAAWWQGWELTCQLYELAEQRKAAV